MQSQRTHRKSVRLSRFKWSKHTISLLKTCQITRTNTKQADVQTQKRHVFAQCQTFFTAKTNKNSKNIPNHGVAGGIWPPWILKFSAKKVIILVFSAKNKFNHFWPPLEKFWKNPLVPPTLEKIIPTPMFRTMTCLPNHYQKDQYGGNWHMKMPTWPTLTFKSEVQAKQQRDHRVHGTQPCKNTCLGCSHIVLTETHLHEPSKQHQLVKPMQ